MTSGLILMVLSTSDYAKEVMMISTEHTKTKKKYIHSGLVLGKTANTVYNLYVKIKKRCTVPLNLPCMRILEISFKMLFFQKVYTREWCALHQ